MNWRLSALDRYTLVSNSDAHSPSKLGREACRFETPCTYRSVFEALRTRKGYGGTIEFFPEEGKYHFDGHRKCGVCFSPAETRRHGGRCPQCGKELTLGVMHRVEQLADRPELSQPPPGSSPFRSLVPLEEILGELLQVGPKSKQVARRYETLLARLGPELALLESVPLEDIRREGGSLLAEAISRLRSGRVRRQPGFDGEYGVIRLFDPQELKSGSSTGLLFDLPQPDLSPERTRARGADKPDTLPEATAASAAEAAAGQSHSGEAAFGMQETRQSAPPRPIAPTPDASAPAAGRSEDRAGGTCGQAGRPLPALLGALDEQQRAAATIVEGPLVIIAGPGTGKTRTLTHRKAYLISHHGAEPDRCLAITFTRRAAEEMRTRLAELLGPEQSRQVPVMTFHALGYHLLRRYGDRLGLGPAVRVAGRKESIGLLQELFELSARRAQRCMEAISQLKRRSAAAEEAPAEADSRQDELRRRAAAYDRALRARGLVDLDDLLVLPERLLREDEQVRREVQAAYRWVSVDEFQDVEPVQYELLRLMVPPEGNLCVIGDPDQAIYGFRGGDAGCFRRFEQDYPRARRVVLKRNYRTIGPILDTSMRLIARASLVPDRSLEAVLDGLDRVEIHEAPTERAEAERVVHTIERMIGGSTFFSMDSGRVEHDEGGGLSFADFAILYRTEAQAGELVEALARSGMPFQRHGHRSLAEHPALEPLLAEVDRQDDKLPPAERIDRAAAALAAQVPEAEALRLPLKALAEKCGGLGERFYSELALGVDVDLWDPRADRVSLLTLHAAKGLEFEVVFIVGCEDGLLPLSFAPSRQKADGSPADKQPAESSETEESDAPAPPDRPVDAEADEERRLLFVGMTRARRRLILTWARRRFWQGRIRKRRPSPFLEDIRELLLDRRERHTRKRRRGQDHTAQRTLFEL